MTRRRGTQISLQSGLQKITGSLGAGGMTRQVRISRLWETIAGEVVSGHTTGAHLDGTCLIVYVDEPAWATELTALSGEYLKRFETEMGQGAVESMRFIVSRRVAEKNRFIAAEKESEAAREKISPVPLSDIEQAQIQASAAEIPDEKVREAVIRATIAGLAWKKGQDRARRRQNRP